MKWILPEDWLPTEESGDILFCTNYNTYVQAGYVQGNRICPYDVFAGAKCQMNELTHWMPYPVHPEEQNQ